MEWGPGESYIPYHFHSLRFVGRKKMIVHENHDVVPLLEVTEQVTFHYWMLEIIKAAYLSLYGHSLCLCRNFLYSHSIEELPMQMITFPVFSIRQSLLENF